MKVMIQKHPIRTNFKVVRIGCMPFSDPVRPMNIERGTGGPQGSVIELHE